MSRPLTEQSGALDLWSEGAVRPAGSAPDRFVGPALAAAIAAGLVVAARLVAHEPQGGTLALSLVLGSLFGFVLQRSRFCFFCLWRDLIDHGDPRGALGVLAALAVGLA